MSDEQTENKVFYDIWERVQKLFQTQDEKNTYFAGQIRGFNAKLNIAADCDMDRLERIE